MEEYSSDIEFKDSETLYDRLSNTGVVANLLFYIEHISAWHSAISKHYSFISKKGICKGRQIQIFEDEDKDQDRRLLTVNLYQNGTVMVQGNKAALGSFVQAFSTLKIIAKKNKGRTPNSCITQTNSQVHNTAQNFPILDHANQHPDHHTVNLLRDRLALLEVELTKLLSTSTNPTQSWKTDLQPAK